MSLASSDPFAKPLINPGYLTSNFDVFTMIQAIKDMQTFMASDPWKDFIIGPVGQLANLTTDDQLELFARNASISINHSIGTARMSPFGAEWGVANPDLSVKGTRGLSVADASIFVRPLQFVMTHKNLTYRPNTQALDTRVSYASTHLHCRRTCC